MSSQLEKLKAEEAEAEAQMLGTIIAPTEPIIPPEEVVEVVPEIVPEVIPEPTSQPEKKKRTNWKHRWSTYKAATDVTLFEQRNEIAQLKEELANAKLSIGTLQSQEVQGDPWEGVFSQEDEDAFGAEGLDVVKKATNKVLENQVKPLQAQIAAQDLHRANELKRQASNENLRQYAEFARNLKVLVPNYEELNVDKNFLEWMKHPDPYSGLQRNKLFLQAESGKDVARVAEFFVEYSQSIAKPNPSPLEQHITPVGSGGAAPVTPPSNDPPEVIYTSEIDKFYDDVMKGRYEGRHKEVLEIEAKIDKASQIPGGIRQG